MQVEHDVDAPRTHANTARSALADLVSIHSIFSGYSSTGITLSHAARYASTSSPGRARGHKEHAAADETAHRTRHARLLKCFVNVERDM